MDIDMDVSPVFVHSVTLNLNKGSDAISLAAKSLKGKEWDISGFGWAMNSSVTSISSFFPTAMETGSLARRSFQDFPLSSKARRPAQCGKSRKVNESASLRRVISKGPGSNQVRSTCRVKNDQQR